MPRTKNTPPSPKRRRSLQLVIAVTILVLTVGVATAAATASIEQVWSFNGGAIAIQPEPGGNGALEGVVVNPTKFQTCIHPDGQIIWKKMTLQADGSYWGFHQWYKTETCTENPELGPTAWRVVEEPGDSSALRVCLSHPGTAQPTIPPGSEGVGATLGCIDSTFIAPVPVVGGNGGSSTNPGTGSSGTAAYKESLTLPSAKKCLSARLFQIHLQDPTYDPFKTVSVTLKGRKIATVKRGKYVVATINLKGLPHGKFTIKIAVTTVLGHHLSATRTYHTCAKKPKKSKPKTLS
jgi:hypothetical protein